MPYRFEAVFQRIPQATAITRVSDGTFLQVNDRMLQMTGFSREEIVGESTVTLGLCTAEERAEYMAALVSPHEGRTVISLRRKDGTPIPLALSSSKIDFGGEACIVTVGVDITEQRAYEEALRAADQRKDVAMALLAHELRNPLMPIVFSAELLRQQADEQARKSLDVIIRQAKYLERLLENLLDVSGVARGKVVLSKTRFEVSRIVARAVEAAGPLLAARRQRLEVLVPDTGFAIDADEVRLTQVLTNLLANAARYSEPGGCVFLSAARDGDDVLLRVRDSGIGIDAALLPDIFKVFVQGGRAPAGESAYHGLGLGLSLVQMLTEMHGGTVAAQSDGPGRGSEFTVRLPAARAM